MTTIQDFPWTVIESPRASFKKQCMERMGVLSKELGSAEYDGPQRVCPARWRHTSTIYILDPVEIGVYVATSLNDRFHYQVLKSEESVITDIEKFCHPKSKTVPTLIRIPAGKNHHDENIIVIHNPPPDLEKLLLEFDESFIIRHLLAHGKFDAARGNTYVDTGYASAKSQCRDPEAACVSLPAKLTLTDNPGFVESMVHLSRVTDHLCDVYQRKRLFREDGIDVEWSRKIHPDNLLQASRSSLAFATSGFGPHMDTQNDQRAFMSPVPVIHRILETLHGLARFARIGYSRKACYEAGLRRKLLEPIVREVSKWYRTLPSTRRIVNNQLYELGGGSGIVREEYGLVLPVHCCKTLGLSPFIDALMKMQTSFGLSRQHCVAVAYNIVASERPFYFRTVAKDYTDNIEEETLRVKALSAIDLAVEFWNRMGEKETSGLFRRVPSTGTNHTAVPGPASIL